jgi:hypothetical protein
VGQDRLAGVRDGTHADSSGATVATLDGDRDERLAARAAPAPAWLDPAEHCLVDLHDAVEQLAAGADHRTRELV